MSRLAIGFFIAAVIFAGVHQVAVTGSLYWYYWWFDILMHFWGGVLLGLGVHVLCQLKSVPLQPTLPLLLVTITTTTVSWELFEWFTGLYNPIEYVADTASDILLAFVGGLLIHFILRHLYNKHI